MYLVTGGSGFIGSHLVDLLIQTGHKVRVLDDRSNALPRSSCPEAEYLYGSIVDKRLLHQALDGVAGVFHLAAKVSVPESITHWHKTHLVNCGGTVHLFELAKKIPIVFASTAAIYGDCSALPHSEETPPHPFSPYAVDKLSCEMHAKIAWELHGTPSIACRFFNVYGPRQIPSSPYSGVISKFSDMSLRKEPFIIYGDGNQCRDFIYVKDVAQMLLQAMKATLVGARTYNFCTGKACTINELADLIGRIKGITVKKMYAPPRPGDVCFSLGDPSKALKELNVKASTSLEEGLKEYSKSLESDVK